MQVDQVYLEPVQTLLSQWIASSKLQHCTTHVTGCGWCVGMWTCMWVFKGHMHVYMLMRDTEGRKEQARPYMYMYKQKAKQHNTPKTVIFRKKNELPRVGFEPTTLHTLDRILYQLNCLGWLSPNLTSHSVPDEKAN